MSRRIKFTLEGDAAQLLRENKRLVDSQRDVEKSFEKTAQAGEAASRRLNKAAKDVDPYDVAQVGSGGSGVVSRGTAARRGSPRTYGVAPFNVRVAGGMPPPIQPPSGGGVYEFADDVSARLKAHGEHVRRRWQRERAVRLGRERQTAEAAAAETAAENESRGEHMRRRWQRERAVREGREAQENEARGEHMRRRWRREELRDRLQARRDRWSNLGERLRSDGSTLWGMAGAYVGVSAVQGYLGERDEKMRGWGDKLIGFDQSIAPLMGVGDNYKNRDRITRELLGMSSGLGIDPAQIAAARFSIESGASNLTEEQRQALLEQSAQVHKFQGTDMQIAGKALNKIVQVFGDDLEDGGKGVKQALNKLVLAADKGDFEIEDAAKYIPDLAGTFKAMGFSLDDALAALTVGSQKGGRMETIFTGLRNVSLRSQQEEAEKKTGIKLSSDFGEMLKQIAGWNGQEMIDVFGAEAIAMAKNLSEATDEFEKVRTQLRRMSGDVSIAQMKNDAGMADRSRATVEILRSARVTGQNIELAKAQDPDMQANLTYAALVDNYVEKYSDPVAPEAWKGLKKWWNYYTDNPNVMRVAVNDQMTAFQDGGEQFKADYLKLQQGKYSGTQLKMAVSAADLAKLNAGGERERDGWRFEGIENQNHRSFAGMAWGGPRYTGGYWVASTNQDQADEFAQLHQQYGNLGVSDYLNYKELMFKGKAADANQLLLRKMTGAQVAGNLIDPMVEAGNYLSKLGEGSPLLGDIFGGVGGGLKQGAKLLEDYANPKQQVSAEEAQLKAAQMQLDASTRMQEAVKNMPRQPGQPAYQPTAPNSTQ